MDCAREKSSMRGKVAKELRRKVYGKDLSPRDRDYNKLWPLGRWLHQTVTLKKGNLNAGDLRRQHQDLKKQYKKGDNHVNTPRRQSKG